MKRALFAVGVASVLATMSLVGCGGSDDEEENPPGDGAGGSTAGSAGTGGSTAGSSGKGGSGGGTAGSGGAGAGGAGAGGAGAGGAGAGGAGAGGAGAGGAGAGGAGAGGAGAGGGAGWPAPACGTIAGTAAVTFTKDEGATLAPTATKLTGIGYTYGLVTLSAPGALVAEHAGKVLRSTDSGCTWKEIGAAPTTPMVLSAAGATRAYAWQDNGKALARIEGETVTTLKAPATIVGLAASKTDPGRVRLGGEGASLWDSKDGGSTWDPTGQKAPVDAGLLYRIAFDPADLDHVLVGVATGGIAMTKDGGQSWKIATGLTQGAKGANAFSIAVSPADGNVVWAEGIDLTENLANAPGEGRHIWRSTDGGLTFAPVLGQTPDVTLRNGTTLAPHPTDAGVLYFVFGTYFQGYGTDLFRYDAGPKALTMTHNAYDDVSAIAFSPVDPALMFLGLTRDNPN